MGCIIVDMNRTLTALLAVLLLAACADEAAPPAPAADADAGKVIVSENCTGCHGLDGQGRTAEIPNLAAQPAGYLVEAMHAYRRDQRHHAALRDLIEGFSEADIRNIAAYFSGLPPLPPGPETEGGDSYRQGKRVAAACTSCHGERGHSTEAGIPSLAGQQPAYLIMSTQEYARGNRGHSSKQQMLEGLGDIDIEQMAMYFASQRPDPRDPPPFGDPQAGEPLTAVCGSCHGARGVSKDPTIPSLAGQEPVYLVNAIKAYRSQARIHEDMVANKTDAQIEDIAAFYAVQTAARTDVNEVDLEEAVAKCNRCHHRPEDESALVVPRLKGQHRDYLVRVMREYRENDRGNDMMHKMSAAYDTDMIERIADYYASQSPD